MSAHQEYIDKELTPLFQQLIKSLLVTKPDDPVPFMISWLKKHLGQESVMSEKEELHMLRREMARLKTKPEQGSEGEQTDSDDDDYMEDNPLPAKKQQRGAVSAEVYGKHNPKEAFEPRVIPKSDQQKERILQRLSQAFMFSALDDQEREIVINSFEERKANPGEHIIRQGEDGGELFVVDSGLLKCYKRFPGAEEDKYLKDYVPGEAFGELALLYNAPRAATIIADQESILWVLDRACFNHIVKDAAAKKRERWEEFLARVEILSDMDPYERSQLADALRTQAFNEGETVLNEGDQGDDFYIIEEGTAIATKTINQGQAPQKVKEYNVGDYFGELALLKNEPRAANIIATSPLKCVSLDRHSFKRLLGPLENIMQRNAAKYEEILNSLREQQDQQL